MFRPMRRAKKAIPDEAAKRLLQTERRGVLAVNGDLGYPYAVPVNFLYDEAAGKLYFHGARAGHKADALRRDARVCLPRNIIPTLRRSRRSLRTPDGPCRFLRSRSSI